MSRLGLGCTAAIVAGLALAGAGCGGSGGDTRVVTEKVVKVKTVGDGGGATPVAASHTPSTAASGSGGGSATVPDLSDERLDVAESALRRRGLRFKEIGGGTFGIVVRSNWTVCSTEPGAGKTTSGRVRLIVDRSCDSSASAASAPSSSSSSSGSSTVPDLVGQRLDVAEDTLRQAGVHYREIGGGTFGIIVKSDWTVCQTNPPAGSAAGGSVGLVVDRAC